MNMKVYLKTEYDKKQIGFSSNNDDLLDVIKRINPKRLNKENLIGDYLVEITSTTFSSYNFIIILIIKLIKKMIILKKMNLMMMMLV